MNLTTTPIFRHDPTWQTPPVRSGISIFLSAFQNFSLSAFLHFLPSPRSPVFATYFAEDRKVKKASTGRPIPPPDLPTAINPKENSLATISAMSRQTNSPAPINVICIHWGDMYQAKDINNLHSMVTRNTSFPIQFHLFSDTPPAELSPQINIHPEPGLNIPENINRFSYRKEAGLCDDQLGGLNGQRVFFFDLDVVITGNLDELFQYPKDNKFYIINDWNTRGNHVGQATCYSFVVGTLGFVKSDYEANPEHYQKKYGTASQEYLSSKVIDHIGPLNFWPDEWFRSFRFHCLPHPLLRWFKTPSRPQPSAKVIAFHGHPDIQDAIIGRWGQPGNRKHPSGWKKIYKHCLPTPWVLEYWK